MYEALFWHDAESIVAFMEPLIAALRLSDSEGCTMGIIYEFMDKVGAAFNTCNLFDDNRMDEIKAIWQNRWNWFHRPIHAVAHIFHPLWRQESQRHDRELNAGWRSYSSIMEPDPMRQDMLETQLLPVSWWEKYGGDCRELQRIAMRVLSQDCSSGACERNWSLFAAIHTKKRNCLTPAQLKRLVFVNSNLKLLRKREKTKAINEINPDTFKVEIPLEELVHPRDEEDEVWALLAAERTSFAHQTRMRTGTIGHGRGKGRGRGRGRGRSRRIEPDLEGEIEAETKREAEAEAEGATSDWSVTEEDEDDDIGHDSEHSSDDSDER
ncbi:hypothetical protein L7F22_049772 [Adiantum nelumboides]|nr:hypothetical protein [Adiantum nelumboides]